MRRRGDGTTDLHARLADAVANRLLTDLAAYTSPRQPQQQAEHPGPTGPTDRRPYERKLGHALGSLLEHLDPHRLPLHGGDAAAVGHRRAADRPARRIHASGPAQPRR